jgi:hypothetical protein
MRASWPSVSPLERGVLRDTDTLVRLPQDDDWFITDSFRSSAARWAHRSAPRSRCLPISARQPGQSLTTGAFDNPLQLLQLDRTSSVAFFSVGAPVGSHGDWNVRAAMNQSDLSSWMLAGSYVVKAQVPHQYRFGMAYSLQRYEGGNTAALQALSDTARNVGSMFAYDEANLPLRRVGYGANYALRLHDGPAMLSPSFARRSRRPRVAPRPGIARSARPAPRNSFRRHPPNTCRRSAPSRRSRRRASGRRSCGTTSSPSSAC